MVSLEHRTFAARPHRSFVAFRPFGDVMRGSVFVFDTPPSRLLVCLTHQPLFGASFRTCHSPWVTLRARPAPRLRSWSPHQARTLAWNL